MEKKPFKPFKRFTKPGYEKKPFGSRPGFKKSYGSQPARPGFSRSKFGSGASAPIRSTSRFGESAPKADAPAPRTERTSSWGAKPAWGAGRPARPATGRPAWKSGVKPAWKSAEKPAWKPSAPRSDVKPRWESKLSGKRDLDTRWPKPRVSDGAERPTWQKPAFAPKPKPAPTSWGGVASWYHDVVEEKGSYQKDLILPNLLRLMDVKKGETVLDLACGEGFFSRRFNRLGANVVASDISKELIEIAKQDNDAQGVRFEVAPADKIPFVVDNSIDKAVIILALQNIENATGALSECSRTLKKGGRLFLVLNHPAFRIPKESSWGFDQEKAVQYRRVDRYMSESRNKMQMHPGDKPDELTVSFHRPFQYFFKAFKKVGLAVVNMEEWVSERKSEPGPRAEAENRARNEFPLFVMLEVVKI